MSYQKLSDKQLKDKVVEFQYVIKLRKNMPENIDEVLLLRLLKFFNGNVEKALNRLVANIELRKSYPNILYNRDALLPRLRKLIDQIEMVIMPETTPKNNRIVLIRLIDFIPENLIFEDALSVFTMVHDTSIITPDEGKITDGEIVIFDLNGVTAKHLTQLKYSSIRCFFKYMADVHPFKIKEVHVINCHSLLDKLVMIMKPLLGAKAMKVIHFHLPNSTTLYDFVARELLVNEFGGSWGPIETLKWYWINRTDDHRDYLLVDDRWKCVERKEEPMDDEEALSYLGFC